MRGAVAILFVLMLVGTLFAQAELLPVTINARSLAMGGCVAAQGNGIGGMLRNPASLGWMETGAVSLSGRSYLFGSTGFDEDVYDNMGLKDYKASFGIHPKLNGIAFATPIPVNGPIAVVGGIGWGSFLDFANKMKTTYTDTDDDTDYEINQTNKGGFHLLMPVVAARFAENYVVGFGYGFAILSPGGYIMEAEVSYPGGSDDLTEEVTEKITGSMIQIGGQARFMDAMNVGFTYYPGFTVKHDDREYDYDYGGTNQGSGDYDDIKLEVPAYYAFGASYDVTPEVTIVAEYQNRPYDDIEVNNDKENYVENGSSLRAGVEYRGPVALRAGFFTDKLHQAAEPGEEDPASGMGITGGVGFVAGPVDVDVTAFYMSGKWEEDAGARNEDYKNTLIGVAATATYEVDVFGGGGKSGGYRR